MKKIRTLPMTDFRVQTIKEFILMHNLNSNDTIVLNQIDFDELALNSRDSYDSSITLPFTISGVEIIEDVFYQVRPNHIGVMKS